MYSKLNGSGIVVIEQDSSQVMDTAVKLFVTSLPEISELISIMKLIYEPPGTELISVEVDVEV